MVKYLLIFINVAVLFVYNLFFGNEVTVSISSPNTSSPGSSFIVELTINKGAVVGFAKLQQDLPTGFSAELINAAGASFTFSNQSLKFIWTQLPENAEFKVSYKVTVADDAEGTKEFDGKFSYVADNSKLSVSIPKTSILITDEKVETTTPQIVASIDTTPKKDDSGSVPTITPSTPQEVTCERKMPTEAQESFMVEVTLDKGTIAGFAKLQENLPDGFTAVAVETSGASFTFSDQQVKFVWSNLPPKEKIVVSYKVMAAKSLVAQKNIDGVFSYLENDETRKSLIAQSSIFVNNAQEGTEQPVVTQQPEMKEKEVVATVTPKITSPDANVNYKVQICALKKRRTPVSYFAETFAIEENIYLENHEGWVKYTMGAYDEYKQARDNRERIRTKGINGVFVTSYDKGKRITVQEALMITGQQWYK